MAVTPAWRRDAGVVVGALRIHAVGVVGSRCCSPAVTMRGDSAARDEAIARIALGYARSKRREQKAA